MWLEKWDAVKADTKQMLIEMYRAGLRRGGRILSEMYLLLSFRSVRQLTSPVL